MILKRLQDQKKGSEIFSFLILLINIYVLIDFFSALLNHGVFLLRDLLYM
jgi:hypothetical protein